MRALILANGDQPPVELLHACRASADLFIATDGAANVLHALGLAADMVVGDMDSICPEVAADLANGTTILATDQESSDLDKALTLARDRSITHVTILGAGGGRMDHTLTALSLLLKHQPPLEIDVRYASSTLRLVRDECVIQGAEGDILSLVVFEPAEGVTLSGVKWPLIDEPVYPGSRAVSNRLTAPTVRLTVRSGWVLVCHESGSNDSAAV